MNIKELNTLLHKNLNTLYPKEEIQVFYFILLDFYGNISKTEALMSPELEISKSMENSLLKAIEQLKTEKPIQYILGETQFFSNRFFVNENVLIPRQETEELVAWIMSETDKNQEVTILDIGCGSGCISVSLAKALPKTKVHALDISAKALEITQKNAQENGVTIHLIHQDILQTNSLSEKYDVIVSNPPYVRELEKREIQNNILNYEPHLALFVPDENPLLFYEKIADLAIKSLNEKGKLFFEINQYLGKETSEMLINKGFRDIQLRKDLSGNPRMIKAEI